MKNEILRNRSDVLDKEMATLKSELQQQISQSVTLQAQLSASQQEWDRYKAYLIEETQKQMYQHKIEFTDLQKRNLELDKEVATLRERSEQLTSVKLNYESENHDLKQRITEKMCEVNSFKKRSLE